MLLILKLKKDNFWHFWVQRRALLETKESHACWQEALIRSRSPSQRRPPVSLALACGARCLASWSSRWSAQELICSAAGSAYSPGTWTARTRSAGLGRTLLQVLLSRWLPTSERSWVGGLWSGPAQDQYLSLCRVNFAAFCKIHFGSQDEHNLPSIHKDCSTNNEWESPDPSSRWSSWSPSWSPLPRCSSACPQHCTQSQSHQQPLTDASELLAVAHPVLLCHKTWNVYKERKDWDQVQGAFKRRQNLWK